MAWDPVWENIFSNQSWGKYPGEDLIGGFNSEVQLL